MLPLVLAGIGGALLLRNPKRKRRKTRRNPLTYGTFQTLGPAVEMAVAGAKAKKQTAFVSINRNRTYSAHYANAAGHIRSARIKAVVSPSGMVTKGYDAQRAHAKFFNLSGYDGPTPFKSNPSRGAVRIPKKEWYADGGFANSRLFRTQKRGGWHYYRRNPPYRYLFGRTCVSPTSGLTYKVRYDADVQEWQVAAFKDGKFQEGPTYYASDKEDALAQLAAMAKGLDRRSNPRRKNPMSRATERAYNAWQRAANVAPSRSPHISVWRKRTERIRRLKEKYEASLRKDKDAGLLNNPGLSPKRDLATAIKAHNRRAEITANDNYNLANNLGSQHARTICRLAAMSDTGEVSSKVTMATLRRWAAGLLPPGAGYKSQDRHPWMEPYLAVIGA